MGSCSKKTGRWRVAILRPGNNPIAELANALGAHEALGPLLQQTAEMPRLLQATLRRGELGLIEVTQEASLPPQDKLFILVDQFEELFRFMRSTVNNSQDEARAFVKLLLAATDQHELPIYVAVTMRSEFLGQCASLPGLPEAINHGLYLLPQMTREQLREVIEEPIAAHHGTITARLVNRLLNDTGNTADQLPILQHALMRLWSLWLPDCQHGPIDIEHYEHKRIGKLELALFRHADEAFDELNKRQQAIAQSLFKQITEMTPDRQTIRRPSTLEAICQRAHASQAEIIAVIDTFRQEGRSFLMPPSDVQLTSERMIDISHESLIRQWGKLRAWAEEEAQATEVRRRLQDNAQLWAREGRNVDGLYRGARLAQALEWQRDNRDTLSDVEEEFLQQSSVREEQEKQRDLEAARVLATESEKRRQAEEERAEEANQRANEQATTARRFRRLALLLIGALLVTGGLGLLTWRLLNESRKANSEARAALSKQLAFRAEIFRNQNSALLELSTLIAVEAMRLFSSFEADQSLRPGFALLQRAAMRLTHESSVIQVAFSPDGKGLATASADKTARLSLWRPEDMIAAACARLNRNLTLAEWRQYLGDEPYRKTCADLPIGSDFLDEGRKLATAGELEEAIAIFREARSLDYSLALDPESEANKLAAPAFVKKGNQLATEGKIQEALAAYAQAQQTDPKVNISAEDWNEICWDGSLWGQVATVMAACEQAVRLSPQKGMIRDSRGLARALTGNTKGAIEDFSFYLEELQKGKTSDSIESKKKQRTEWIAALKAGKNPFDAKTLKQLRGQ